MSIHSVKLVIIDADSKLSSTLSLLALQIRRKIQRNTANCRSIFWATPALKKSYQDEWIIGPTKQGYEVRHNEQPYGEWSFINCKYIYHRKRTLIDIKLTNTFSECIYTTNLPKYCPETSAETQWISTQVSLFYILRHPLSHGPIFNIKQSVTIVP